MANLQKTISVNHFIERLRASDVLMIDVRTPVEMGFEYCDGSVNIPLQDITAQSINDYKKNKGCSSDEPVYMLCASGQRATKAVAQLNDQIDSPLVIVEGGINAMKQAGFELKQGSGTVMSLERQVRIAAGSLVLVGAGLGTWVNPSFYLLSAFVGAGLVFAGLTNTCGMGLLLARMPWNRVG